MDIIAIVARSKNDVIGNNGRLPWPHNRQDLSWFKQLTDGHPIIMGRATFESLPGVLPNRPHFVVTSSVDKLTVTGGIAFLPVREVIAQLERFKAQGLRRVFIVGGAKLFEKLGPLCNVLMLRTFDKEYEGDVMFPGSAFKGLHMLFSEQWDDSITCTYTRSDTPSLRRIQSDTCNRMRTKTYHMRLKYDRQA